MNNLIASLTSLAVILLLFIAVYISTALTSELETYRTITFSIIVIIGTASYVGCYYYLDKLKNK